MANGHEGRSCPLHYRYRPEQLRVPAENWAADVVYVAGGLYGNVRALDTLEALVASDRAAGLRVRLLFNGDFNWFNADVGLFEEINRRVLAYDAMLGNVEYELAHPSDGAGCGCAYPDFVDDQVVARSNRIMDRLQRVASQHPPIRQALGELPRWRSLILGGLKVLVVHGDPESLAGWGLAHEYLEAGSDEQLVDWFRRTDADVMVSSHTCLPALWSATVDGRPRCLLNNGSAGMGNVRADSRGLVARLAHGAGFGQSVPGSLARRVQGPLEISLVPLAFDTAAWLTQFDRIWPAGSDAAESYRDRIQHGTRLGPDELVFEGPQSA
ncbi:MAG: hypothetical protein R3303_05875 [Marinobacter sp.]|nr:hypothetical protein [Marinobacter sp.]